MPTQVKVIIGKNKVYATYAKTICFEQEYKGVASVDSEEEMHAAIHSAQAAAFSYGLTFGTISIDRVYRLDIENIDDLFDYLEKCNA